MGVKAQIQQDAMNGYGLARPFLLAGAPTSGGSGTYVGVAQIGSLLIDTSGGKLYIATNATTPTSVTWQVAGLQT